MTNSGDGLLTSHGAVGATPSATPGKRPGRLLRATILLGWLAISVGSAALSVVLFAVERLAWSLSECLDPGRCAPRGEPPGPEILIVGAVVAVPALLLIFLVGLAPTRRTYTISFGAASLLFAMLIAARAQVGNLVPLPDLVAAFAQQPMEALAYVLGQIPDLLVVLAVALASRSARRNTSL